MRIKSLSLLFSCLFFSVPELRRLAEAAQVVSLLMFAGLRRMCKHRLHIKRAFLKIENQF